MRGVVSSCVSFSFLRQLIVIFQSWLNCSNPSRTSSARARGAQWGRDTHSPRLSQGPKGLFSQTRL